MNVIFIIKLVSYHIASYYNIVVKNFKSRALGSNSTSAI